MKALLINGSPNAKGCTFTALSLVAEELQKNGVETEIVHVGHKNIHGCNIAFLVKAITAEKERNGLPEAEEAVFTNFIRIK